MNELTWLRPVLARFQQLSRRVRTRRALMVRRANPVQIIAHRGASHLAPENTLASIRLAWELGADAVEVDVHRTGDGRVVVIHDDTTVRTAGAHLSIAETSSGRLRRLDVGRHKDKGYAGEAIPFLEEVLDTVPPGRRLFVDVKCGPEVLPLLDRLTAHSGKRHQVVIIGFDLDTIRVAKTTMPDVPVHWLCDTLLWTPHRCFLPWKTKASGVDGLSVHWSGLTPRFVSAIRRWRLKLYAWTVDDPGEGLHLKALGVDGITTNRPGWLRTRMGHPPW